MGGGGGRGDGGRQVDKRSFLTEYFVYSAKGRPPLKKDGQREYVGKVGGVDYMDRAVLTEIDTL
jgi:hypothetical protein